MGTHSRAEHWFDRMEQIELPVCQYFNRANNFKLINLFFKSVSRLGDGVFWYCLIALTVIINGKASIMPTLHMLITGCIGVLIYKQLKERLVRERPFISHDVISCNTRPLDRYSFPSGHTLHAASFSAMLAFYYPNLSWPVFFFATMVASSRFVLGLHYISDVVVGGLIGATIAAFSLQFSFYLN